MFNILISLPYLLTGIFISVFVEYTNWFVLEKTNLSILVSVYVAFGYLFLSLFIIFLNKRIVIFSKKNVLVLFNIIAIFFILIIHYSDASLTLLFLCYIFFIIYRYIEQSCRFSYYKNILKDSNKYNFANSLLEFNRQSITLVAGILFIFFRSSI